MLIGAVVGRGAFYYVTMASVVAVLALSANTSFADFPRLCRVLALRSLSSRTPSPSAGGASSSRTASSCSRLLAGAALVAFGGVTDG